MLLILSRSLKETELLTTKISTLEQSLKGNTAASMFDTCLAGLENSVRQFESKLKKFKLKTFKRDTKDYNLTSS